MCTTHWTLFVHLVHNATRLLLGLMVPTTLNDAVPTTVNAPCIFWPALKLSTMLLDLMLHALHIECFLYTLLLNSMIPTTPCILSRLVTRLNEVHCYIERFLYTLLLDFMIPTTLCRLIERLFVHFAIDLVYLLDLMKCTTHWTLSVHLIVPTTLVTCPRPDDVYYTLDAFCTLCTLGYNAFVHFCTLW